MEQVLEKISGTVEDVTFHSEESGFTVLLVDVDGDPVTVVGEVPQIAEGEEITATGSYKVHGTYGVQFRAELIERTLPATAGAIRKYLASGAVKGVGPTLAGRIVARFGDDTLTVIEQEPERLTEVRGISPEKARKIGEEYRRQFGIRTVMSLLASLGLPAATAIKAWRRWGANTAEVLKADPYTLCCEEIGVEFEEADRIAEHFGVAGEDPCRLGAGLQYILRVNSRSGHTCLPKKKLLTLAAEFLQAAPEGLENTLTVLTEDNTLAAYAVGEKEYIYLQPLYRAESYVASRVCIALQLQPPRLEPMEDELDELERLQGITYDPVQRRAITEAVQSRLFILTGGPGTGKTTTLRGILALLEQRGEKVALAAPTGRAAKRMAEITGREASTIHRLLEVEPKTETLTFKRGEKNPLPADAVIVDEMSMVDTLLMEHLLRGMRLGARLIMVGDSDQLPSVAAGNVLRDLIQSGLVPCIHLERVFRQAAESLIVTNAHAIVRGEMPELGCRTGDFFFLQHPDAFDQQRLVVDLVSRRLPKSYGYDPLRDIQVITPAKQGPLGTRELNRLLQNKLNPPMKGKSEAVLMGRTLREGDKVMQVRNNYDIVWQQPDGTAGTGIFNGDMGMIEMLDNGSKTIQVRFEDKLATYSFENQDQLEHAYAVTVHKSQGSEFEAVVMPLERRHPRLHYRNLLYTAVTRARRLLIMTGQKETVYAMVQNDRRTLRYTNQKEMLREMVEE